MDQAVKIDPAPAGLTDTRHRTGIYGWSPQTGGVHHFRIAEPLRVLADHGIRAFTGVELDDEILGQVDHVLVHTIHDETNTQAIQRLAELGTHKIIFDVDDAMWAPDWAPFRDHYTPAALERLYRNISAAHVVTTPSPVIAEYLARFNPNVVVLPNTVPAWLLHHDMPARDRATIGYQGSPSHINDFTASIGRQLGHFLSDHPDWGVHFYGHTGPVPGDDHAGRLRTSPWVGNVEQYWRQLSFDVGIGPLRRSIFNNAKSSLRAVEYAALGVVACLPDMAPYRQWIIDGVTGRLIHGHQTMRGVLHEIATDTPARLSMAAQARIRAKAWTTEARIEEWTQAWASQ